MQTLISSGLDTKQRAYRLWQKAKRLGTWNPSDLDLSQDRADWLALQNHERDLLLHLASLFMMGEEAVTTELLPLLKVVSEEGRLEEEMFLTSFLWEEAKHVDFFQRFRSEVVVDALDLHGYAGERASLLFEHELGQAMRSLYTDPSPEAQARAATTYNMIVEGVMAETGYHAWYTILKTRGILPGITEGIQLIQRDESRHIGFGLYFLARLIAEHGESVWEVVEETMGRLLPLATSILSETFEAQETRHGTVPFNLELDTFVSFAMNQFQHRMTRLLDARTKTVDEIIWG